MSPVELAALGADDLLAFSRQRGAGLGRTAWNHLATALSGFYRWLDLSGHGGAHLVGAVPSRRRYRLADVRCALSWEQVRRLLGVAGVREPNGRRNYAMLLLIASYGLRGCEVRALRLNDIDWAHDEIVIFAPKTGRRRVLPLTRTAGEAVLDYLLAERPPPRHREVFLSSRPPHGPLRSKINPWLGRQPGKAGIGGSLMEGGRDPFGSARYDPGRHQSATLRPASRVLVWRCIQLSCGAAVRGLS